MKNGSGETDEHGKAKCNASDFHDLKEELRKQSEEVRQQSEELQKQRVMLDKISLSNEKILDLFSKITVGAAHTEQNKDDVGPTSCSNATAESPRHNGVGNGRRTLHKKESVREFSVASLCFGKDWFPDSAKPVQE